MGAPIALARKFLTNPVTKDDPRLLVQLAIGPNKMPMSVFETLESVIDTPDFHLSRHLLPGGERAVGWLHVDYDSADLLERARPTINRLFRR